MKIEELSILEMARHNATHRVVVKAEDLNGTGTGFGALSAASAAATSGTLEPLGDDAAGVSTQFVRWYLATPFDGGDTSELTLAVGYDLASGTDKAAGFQAATSIHADATYIKFAPAEIAAFGTTWGATESAKADALLARIEKVFGVVNTVQLVFTSTGANLSTLTAGEIHLYFNRIDYTKS